MIWIGADVGSYPYRLVLKHIPVQVVKPDGAPRTLPVVEVVAPRVLSRQRPGMGRALPDVRFRTQLVHSSELVGARVPRRSRIYASRVFESSIFFGFGSSGLGTRTSSTPFS